MAINTTAKVKEVVYNGTNIPAGGVELEEIPLVTTSYKGLMSPEDKAALDMLKALGLSVVDGKVCQTYEVE